MTKFLKGIIGFANTGIHEVRTALAKKTDYSSHLYLDEDTPIPEDTDLIYVPNSGYLSTVVKQAEALNHQYVVMLFDVPVRLDGIKGLLMADVKEKKKSFYYDFEKVSYAKVAKALSKFFSSDEPFAINLRRPNVIPVLLKSTASSTLKRLQSWKYGIHPVALRDEVMAKVFEWFIKPDKTVEWLKEEVADLLERDGAADLLFEDDRYIKLKDAVCRCLAAKLEEKSIVTQVADKEKLSAFDIRYIMSAATVGLDYEDTDLLDIYKDIRAKHDKVAEERERAKKKEGK